MTKMAAHQSWYLEPKGFFPSKRTPSWSAQGLLVSEVSQAGKPLGSLEHTPLQAAAQEPESPLTAQLLPEHNQRFIPLGPAA